MKIEQEATYKPITIRLDSQAEAVAFINLIDKASVRNDLSSTENVLAIMISDEFSNKINL